MLDYRPRSKYTQHASSKSINPLTNQTLSPQSVQVMSGYPELEFEEEVDPLTGEVRQVIRHVGIPAQEFLDEERRESERLAQSLTAEVRSRIYVLSAVKKVVLNKSYYRRPSIHCSRQEKKTILLSLETASFKVPVFRGLIASSS